MNTQLIEEWLGGSKEKERELLTSCYISSSTLRAVRCGYRPSAKIVKLLADGIGCSIEELQRPPLPITTNGFPLAVKR